MRHYTLINTFLVAVLIAILSSSTTGFQTARQVSAASILGTWSGQSVCVGERPACKNEMVVYRFEPVPGKPQLLTLLADKIINGKRVPMYRLEIEYDETRRTLSCEYERGRTRGVWEYKINGDTIEGTGIVLSGKSVARQVKVRRVKETEVPRAPARQAYDMN